MENKEPKSQTLCLWVPETAQWARESPASCKEGSSEPSGRQGRRCPQSNRAESPAADAKGDQCGMEQHSGVGSSAVSTVMWSLPQLYLESCILDLSGSFDNCLGIPDGKWGISPGAYLLVVLLCRQGCSGHMCRYLRCVFLPDVSALT